MTLTSHEPLAEYARSVLRQLMAERGATQVQLAGLLGITQVAVSDRVRGRTPLTLADIDRLAAYFDVDPALFVPPVRYRGPGLLPCTFGQLRRPEAISAIAAFPPKPQNSLCFAAA